MSEIVHYNNAVDFHSQLGDLNDKKTITARIIYDMADAVRLKRWGENSGVDINYPNGIQDHSYWQYADYPYNENFSPITVYDLPDQIRAIKTDQLAKQDLKLFFGTSTKLSSDYTGTSNKMYNAQIDTPQDLISADQIVFMAYVHSFNSNMYWYSYEIGNQFVSANSGQSRQYFGLSNASYFNYNGGPNAWTGNPSGNVCPIIDINALFEIDSNTNKWTWKTFDGNIEPCLQMSNNAMTSTSFGTSTTAGVGRWFLLYRT